MNTDQYIVLQNSLWYSYFNNLQAKAQRVTISGLSRTKDDLVANHLREVFKATNFEEVSILMFIITKEI